MPLVPARCTCCGAALTLDPSQDAAVCPYCNTPFVVEKAISNFNTVLQVQNLHADVVNVQGADGLEARLRAAQVFIERRDWESAKHAVAALYRDYPADWRVYWCRLRYSTGDFTSEVQSDETLRREGGSKDWVHSRQFALAQRRAALDRELASAEKYAAGALPAENRAAAAAYRARLDATENALNRLDGQFEAAARARDAESVRLFAEYGPRAAQLRQLYSRNRQIRCQVYRFPALRSLLWDIADLDDIVVTLIILGVGALVLAVAAAALLKASFARMMFCMLTAAAVLYVVCFVGTRVADGVENSRMKACYKTEERLMKQYGELNREYGVDGLGSVDSLNPVSEQRFVERRRQ